MATWDDVHPPGAGTAADGNGILARSLLAGGVEGKTFAWERPLRCVPVAAIGENDSQVRL